MQPVYSIVERKKKEHSQSDIIMSRDQDRHQSDITDTDTRIGCHSPADKTKGEGKCVGSIDPFLCVDNPFGK